MDDRIAYSWFSIIRVRLWNKSVDFKPSILYFYE